MFMKDGVEYRFHHMGIPVTEPRPGERYSALFGMYTRDSDCRLIRAQWHRFEETSPLHPLLRTVPHPAFKVSDLARAIEGMTLLLGPYEPIAGFHVAIVEDGGIPIEFIETELTDDQIWAKAETESILYADNPRAAPVATG
ncbi:hypothetical protein SAMN02745172_01368 [Pseudoxanthobacter soli DSM 19599]|uniref:Uncharacterized protein n=1 Tax=Pseudoxanthobacter soli DSM 19599 TaxID=1123029 RepID=A0A1M7ZET8_9HYPH|nr:hypothetical protein [Pseudoxanthobacter soli]SHO63393.1 hypothetical protein SAMN02745172_01368 [Pseudoxanthobacter soli DSM 19599]